MADEKLAAASQVLEGSFYRDAASRGYYPMFHAAHALVRHHGHSPRTHRGLVHLVADVLKEGDIPEELLTALRRAQRARESGDYEATWDVSDESVEILIENAQRFVEAIRTLLAES